MADACGAAARSAGSATSAAVKRWGKLLGRFDEDGDGGFDDDELLRLFDSIDELPGATDDIKELGGDAGETQRLLFLGMALVLAVLVAIAWLSAMRRKGISGTAPD